MRWHSRTRLAACPVSHYFHPVHSAGRILGSCCGQKFCHNALETFQVELVCIDLVKKLCHVIVAVALIEFHFGDQFPEECRDLHHIHGCLLDGSKHAYGLRILRIYVDIFIIFHDVADRDSLRTNRKCGNQILDDRKHFRLLQHLLDVIVQSREIRHICRQASAAVRIDILQLHQALNLCIPGAIRCAVIMDISHLHLIAQGLKPVHFVYVNPVTLHATLPPKINSIDCLLSYAFSFLPRVSPKASILVLEQEFLIAEADPAVVGKQYLFSVREFISVHIGMIRGLVVLDIVSVILLCDDRMLS